LTDVGAAELLPWGVDSALPAARNLGHCSPKRLWPGQTLRETERRKSCRLFPWPAL